MIATQSCLYVLSYMFSSSPFTLFTQVSVVQANIYTNLARLLHTFVHNRSLEISTLMIISRKTIQSEVKCVAYIKGPPQRLWWSSHSQLYPLEHGRFAQFRVFFVFRKSVLIQSMYTNKANYVPILMYPA